MDVGEFTVWLYLVPCWIEMVLGCPHSMVNLLEGKFLQEIVVGFSKKTWTISLFKAWGNMPRCQMSTSINSAHSTHNHLLVIGDFPLLHNGSLGSEQYYSGIWQHVQTLFELIFKVFCDWCQFGNSVLSYS